VRVPIDHGLDLFDLLADRSEMAKVYRPSAEMVNVATNERSFRRRSRFF